MEKRRNGVKKEIGEGRAFDIFYSASHGYVTNSFHLEEKDLTDAIVNFLTPRGYAIIQDIEMHGE